VGIGGDVKGTGNGGNGGDGGDGGNATIAKASVGGDVSSGNVAVVHQSSEQAIVVVPVAVQHVSARFNGLTHASQ
jgi:hypothetical protein